MNTISTPSLQDSRRWQALKNRDQGEFVYAVLSTGIYCLPGCPARLPRAENVRFFDTSAAAESAGYRACRRCLPDQGGLLKRKQEWVSRACRLIEASPDSATLASLAETAGISISHLHRSFQQLLGCSPKQYATAQRAARTRAALREGETITQTLYDVGFSSSSRFYGTSDTVLGMKPRCFQAGGAGERLRFAIAECTIGTMLIAATARGVCWISLGDEPSRLLHDFQKHFHAAELVGADSDFEQLVAAVVASVQQQTPTATLPLDIRGSAFQLRVWEALSKIPRGATRSYSELAEQIGQPGAVRAVASACAKNQLAVLIPCHRVVRLDGSLSGYRWGVERKAMLLKDEAERELQQRSLAT